MLKLTICFAVASGWSLCADETLRQDTAENRDTASAQFPSGSDEVPVFSTIAAAPAERWLFICCGLPGDDEHRERLTAACRKLVTAAEPALGVSADRVRLLAGDEQMQQDLKEVSSEAGVCSAETVKAGLAELGEKVPQQGACWVVVLGHAHLYGSRSQFNVVDADFDQKEFADWATPIKCREQVFLITPPVSGFWIKPLKAPSRVVITATEADLEYTGTEMPYALTDLLAGDGEHASLEDVDGDGSVSLLDLYLSVNLEIHGRFQALERLQTEHASLDDNGDGRGSEVQLAYMPVEEEDEDDEAEDEEPAELVDEPTSELPKPISNRNLDGFRSRHILLKADRT